eukprot:SAG31_NODE_2216_length_6171_cov_1.851120_1_plen_114_part_00
MCGVRVAYPSSLKTEPRLCMVAAVRGSDGGNLFSRIVSAREYIARAFSRFFSRVRRSSTGSSLVRTLLVPAISRQRGQADQQQAIHFDSHLLQSTDIRCSTAQQLPRHSPRFR